jgi:hypothetical protein
MTILRIVLVGAALVVFMVVAQTHRWPQRVGVVGVCAAAPAPTSTPEAYWYSCREGLITGFPNLEADHCVNIGIVQHRENWQCDVPLASLPGA